MQLYSGLFYDHCSVTHCRHTLIGYQDCTSVNVQKCNLDNWHLEIECIFTNYVTLVQVILVNAINVPIMELSCMVLLSFHSKGVMKEVQLYYIAFLTRTF
jgi:hypothetical protein